MGSSFSYCKTLITLCLQRILLCYFDVGFISVYDLDKKLQSYKDTFYTIFHSKTEYIQVSRALFTIGDYTQEDRWRRRLGNKNARTWREHFTPSSKRGDYDKSRDVMHQLLDKIAEGDTLDSLIQEYLEAYTQVPDKPKDWIYYFVKYEWFWKHTEGYYTWWAKYTNPYECIMMRRTTLGGYNWSPFLKTIYEEFKESTKLENYNAPLEIYTDKLSVRIYNVNSGYRLEYLEETDLEALISLDVGLDENGILTVDQNSSGLDIVDRIEVGRRLIKKLLA